MRLSCDSQALLALPSGASQVRMRICPSATLLRIPCVSPGILCVVLSCRIFRLQFGETAITCASHVIVLRGATLQLPAWVMCCCCSASENFPSSPQHHHTRMSHASSPSPPRTPTNPSPSPVPTEDSWQGFGELSSSPASSENLTADVFPDAVINAPAAPAAPSAATMPPTASKYPALCMRCASHLGKNSKSCWHQVDGGSPASC